MKAFDNIKGLIGYCGIWCGSCVVSNGALRELTQRYEKLLESIHQGRSLGATSVICMAELLSGFYSKGEHQKGDAFLTQTLALDNFLILDVDMRVAKEAAVLRSKYGLKLPDAIVGATCKVYEYDLVTKDRGFVKIKEIKVI